MLGRQKAVLAAGVLTVWALLFVSRFHGDPLFLAKPPVTRRARGFYEFQRDSCSLALAQGSWTDQYRAVSCTPDTQHRFATCAATPQRQWEFSPAAVACGARRFTADEARQALGGKKLVFVGDSIARYMYDAALRLLGEPGQGIVVGHQDFQHELAGDISMRFYWAPFPSNITELLGRFAQLQLLSQRPALPAVQAQQPSRRLQQQQAHGSAHSRHQREQEQQQEQGQGRRQARRRQQEQQQGGDAGAGTTAAVQPEPQQQQGQQWEQQAGQKPVIMVVSTTLWHLLHITAAQDYAARLQELKRAAVTYRETVLATAPRRPAAGGSGVTASMATSGTGTVSDGSSSDGVGNTAAGAGSGSSMGSGAASGAAAAGGWQPLRMVLASGTETFPSLMLSDKKRQNMIPSNVDAYNHAMDEVQLKVPGGPFWLLDLFPLTQHCGQECSTDGVHSQPGVYDAMFQLLLNIAVASDDQLAAQPGVLAEEQDQEQQQLLSEHEGHQHGS